MGKMVINADLIANGAVYASGPVFIQGINVREKFEEIDKKLAQITEEDLRVIKTNIAILIKDFSISGKTRTQLEKIRSWIEAGRNLKEIIAFIRLLWIELGPLVTNVLLQNVH